MENKIRMKVLEKLISLGYDTDKKIMDLNVEELIVKDSINRTELVIAIEIKKSLANKSLISYLSGFKGGDR